MNKLFSILLVMSLFVVDIAARDFSYTFEGQTLMYTVIDEDAKTCKVKQSTSVYDLIGDLIIPELANDGSSDFKVVEIGGSAFSECSFLTSVVIPNSVTTIELNAFYKCENLESIVIPNSVTEICQFAFYKCGNLKYVVIPNSVTDIGPNAFLECSGLESIALSNSITAINSSVFKGCTNLISIDIPNSVITLGDNAFCECRNLKSIKISNSVTAIYSSVFKGCTNLISIDIPNSVIILGDNAFRECRNLKSIKIPNSVTTIGYSAFDDCSNLTSVEIPNSVTTIEDYAFRGCYKLTSVEIPNSVTKIERNAFDGCSSLTSIEIPNSVTSISDEIFRYCSALASVQIPNSIKSIGKAAFAGCSSLTSIEIPNSVTSIGDWTFEYCRSLTSIQIPNSIKSIGIGAFGECESLISINIPNSVTKIREQTFVGCSSLKSVVIPNTVTSIEKIAFYKCYNLTSIEIPNSVSKIGYGAFVDCGLTSVIIPSGIKIIEDSAFGLCDKLKYIYYETTDPIESENAFNHTDQNGGIFNFASIYNKATLYVAKKGLENAKKTTPWKYFNNIEELSNEFYQDGFSYTLDHDGGMHATVTDIDLSEVEYLTIPSHVTIQENEYTVNSIGYKAFSNCRKLKSVEFPETIESYGNEIFKGCDALCSITVNGPALLTDEAIFGFDNPNLLCFIGEKYMEANGTNVAGAIRNVVTIPTEKTQSLSLSEGYPFFSPKNFTAESATFTRSFSMETAIGGSQGWETICVPFDVDDISQGEYTIKSFTSFDASRGTKPFWLYAADNGSWKLADGIAADVPYLISMPHNHVYGDEYNVIGEVLFSGNNVTVKASSVNGYEDDVWRFNTNSRIRPNYNRIPASRDLFVVNDDWYDNSAPGSVFVRGIRDVRPFECYVTSDSAPSYMKIFDNSGVNDFPVSMAKVWTEGSDIMITSPVEADFRIVNSAGQIVRMVRVLPDSTFRVSGLPKGLYFVGHNKILLTH